MPNDDIRAIAIAALGTLGAAFAVVVGAGAIALAKRLATWGAKTTVRKRRKAVKTTSLRPPTKPAP